MKKVKTVIFVFVCVILCFVLQSTILSRLSFGGVQANLMIIETAAFAFCLGELHQILHGIEADDCRTFVVADAAAI